MDSASSNSLTDNLLMPDQFVPSLQSQCKDIESALLNPPYSIVFHFHLVLLFGTLFAIGILVQQYGLHKIKMHGNLSILMINLVIVYFFHILGQFVWLLRYRLILFFYDDPCDLLTPHWMVIIFYGPIYVQSVACPALHFCIMIERVRATMLANKYEKEGNGMGIWMVAIIWLISLLYLAFVAITAYLDPTMPSDFGIIYLASKYSTNPILFVNIFTMFVVLFTAFCDWRITLLNNRMRKTRLRGTVEYSLSLNYQLNENALAMRLILPIDLTYAILYSLFNGLVIVDRFYRASLSLADYRFYYNLINTILFVYTLLTTFVYIRFVQYVSKCQKRIIEVKPKAESTQQYFKELQAQWNRAYHP